VYIYSRLRLSSVRKSSSAANKQEKGHKMFRVSVNGIFYTIGVVYTFASQTMDCHAIGRRRGASRRVGSGRAGSRRPCHRHGRMKKSRFAPRSAHAQCDNGGTRYNELSTHFPQQKVSTKFPNYKCTYPIFVSFFTRPTLEKISIMRALV